jgi:hypothetical protein
LQNEAQHTWSTQRCEPHSLATVHAVPLTLLHVPALPGAAHVFPVPQLACAQQTPSVQKPVAQSLAAAHATPRPATGAHEPELQKYPAAQSAFAAQVTLQAEAPQAKPPHDFAPSAQLPAPSHLPTCRSTPPTHALVPQTRPLGPGPQAVRLVPSHALAQS